MPKGIIEPVICPICGQSCKYIKSHLKDHERKGETINNFRRLPIPEGMKVVQSAQLPEPKTPEKVEIKDAVPFEVKIEAPPVELKPITEIGDIKIPQILPSPEQQIPITPVTAEKPKEPEKKGFWDFLKGKKEEVKPKVQAPYVELLDKNMIGKALAFPADLMSGKVIKRDPTKPLIQAELLPLNENEKDMLASVWIKPINRWLSALTLINPELAVAVLVTILVYGPRVGLFAVKKVSDRKKKYAPFKETSEFSNDEAPESSRIGVVADKGVISGENLEKYQTKRI